MVCKPNRFPVEGSKATPSPDSKAKESINDSVISHKNSEPFEPLTDSLIFLWRNLPQIYNSIYRINKFNQYNYLTKFNIN